MKKIYATLLSLLCLCACENIWMDPSPADTPRAVFQSAWENIRDKYAFFEYKQIDWDSIRLQYEPRINNEMDDQALFDVLADMLNELEDGHVNLFSRFDVSIYRGIEREKDNDTTFVADFYDPELLQERYFIKLHEEDEEIKRSSGFAYKIFTRQNASGIPQKIGYLRYSSFSNSIDLKALDMALERLERENVRGLLLDMRENGGGSLGNVFRLASRLLSIDETTVLSTIYKSGPGVDEFAAPGSYTAKRSGARQFTLPVALLTNRGSFSATSFFAASMRAPGFEHVRSFGNNTGGGSGLPSDFQLPNGWVYRFSTTRTFSPHIDPAQDIFFGKEQFRAVNGGELMHSERLGFDFEAGVPVEFQPDEILFDQAKQRKLDYLLEACMQLIINNSAEDWENTPAGQPIDFELPL